MDDYVDILIANLKVLASVSSSVDEGQKRSTRLTRVSTVSVYYGSGTAIRGNRPSIMSKNTVAGHSYIRRHHAYRRAAQMERSMEFEQDRSDESRFGLQTCDRHIVLDGERLYRYKSHRTTQSLR
jgi:hypothetical protein